MQSGRRASHRAEKHLRGAGAVCRREATFPVRGAVTRRAARGGHYRRVSHVGRRRGTSAGTVPAPQAHNRTALRLISFTLLSLRPSQHHRQRNSAPHQHHRSSSCLLSQSRHHSRLESALLRRRRRAGLVHIRPPDTTRVFAGDVLLWAGLVWSESGSDRTGQGDRRGREE